MSADFVKLVEVGPRDGLQNEKGVVPLEAKVALIDALSEAGCPAVEVGAFVSPKWVPQMADSAEVMAQITRRPGTAYPVLVPNEKGYERARAAGAEEIAIFGAASESFSQRNINCSIAESLERFRPVAEAAKADGVKVRGYVSCVVGCPYEGPIAPAAVAAVTDKLLGLGCYEISLGDTIGVGTPGSIGAMLDAVLAVAPVERVAGHYHDTYGQALANVLISLEKDVLTFDSAVAGLGGCPYAPGASGNVASEDVLYMLHGMGLETGIDLDAVVAAGSAISDVLGRAPASRVAQALTAKSEAARKAS